MGVAALLLVVPAALVSLPSIADAATATLFVDPVGTTVTCTSAGTGACPTVADGIAAAESGSYNGEDVTIDVAAATYNENDTIAASSLSSMTILGAAASTTTINASSPGTVVTINSGTVTLTNLTISGGSNGSGGGVADASATNVTLSGDTLSGDTSTGSLNGGGGFYNVTGATATVAGDTFVSDTAADQGGGVYNGGTITIVNSTFNSNSATGAGVQEGGGVFNGGTATLDDDTFGNNTATFSGGGIEDQSTFGAGISNSIFDNSTCNGTVNDDGHNVDSGSSCGFSTANGSVNNSSTIDLGTLQENPGGFTGPKTMAVGPRSSALDIVPLANCVVNTDESNQPRPGITNQSTPHCDAGAFELQGTGVAPTITSLNNTSFTAGTAGNFSVTTDVSASPTPAINTSGLPSGVTLTDNNDGTATLASTISAAQGTYTFTVTADNGISPAAAQPFTLNIDGPPSFTSANHATLPAGLTGSFTVTTVGPPPPAVTSSGLPAGVSLINNGDGTATLVSTPSVAPGTYNFTLFASNTFSPAASQPFTLTVASAPTAAPTGIGQSAGDGSATITWTDVPPSADGGSAITGYLVQAFQGTTLVGSTTVAPGVGTGTITGLINGTAYTLSAAAQNAVGTGPAATSSPVTPTGLPAAPSGIVATLNPNGSVTLTWSAPNDGGSAITGYVVTTNPGTTNSPYMTGSIATTFTIPAAATGNNLILGTAYNFQVQATNTNGNSALSSPSNTVTPATAPTAAPTGIGQSAGNGSATITWTDVPASANGGNAIAGYVVKAFQGTTMVASKVVAPGVGTGTITGLTNGTTYSLSVAAQNAVGTGPAATSALVTPSSVPGAPSNVVATANPNGSVTLTWAAPPDNGSPITSYVITPSPATTHGNYTTPDAGTTFTIPAGSSDLVLGTDYSFEVAATNADGTGPDSLPSNTVASATAPTVAPTGIGQSAGNGSATITWTDVPNTPPDNGGSSITNYVVKAFQGTTMVASTNVAPGTQTATITGLTNGTAYTLSVAAQNAVGTGPAATSSAVTPSAVPDAPTNVVATANANGTVALTWAAPAANGSTINSYRITVSPTTGTSNFPIDTGTTTTSATIPAVDMTVGTAYTFSVAAHNANGFGPATAANTVTPATAPTAAPTGIGQSAGNGSATITWTDVPNSVPTDGGSVITSYEVKAFQGTTTVASTNVAPGTQTATITGLTNGTAYTLSVAAQNALGTGPAAMSSAVTPSAVPGAPTNVVATANSDGSIALTWAAPPADGSAIDSYRITVSPSTGTSNFPIDTGTTATNVTIPAGDVTVGTAYTLSVAAHNANGFGPATAANSVTPATAPTAAPTGIGQSAGNGSATITWTDVSNAPPDNGGSSVTNYVVKAFQGTTMVASTNVAPGTQTATITGLTNGTAYTLSVAAQNAVGTGPAATSSSVTPSGVPGIPSQPVASANLDGSVTLTWSAPPANGSAITGYTIAVATGSGSHNFPVNTGTTSTTAIIPVADFTPGNTYTLTVAAINATGTGTASAASNPVTPATAPTLAPTLGTASAGDAQATITWTDLTTAQDGGSPITGYLVQAIQGSTVVASMTALPGDTSATLTGLTNGTPYYLSVAGQNAVGTGPTATTASTVTPSAVPGAPSDVIATANPDGSVTLTWSAPPDNGSPITSYTVDVASGTGSHNFPLVTGTTATGYTFPASDFTPGNTYSLAVAATNADGTGTPSVSSNAVTPATAPTAAPALGAPSASDGTATITWTDLTAAQDGGSPITSYVVTAKQGGTTVATMVTTPPTATSATLGGLIDGTTYTLSVAAQNLVGTGPGSTSGPVTPMAPRQQGYWIATAQGGVYNYGGAQVLGAPDAFRLDAPIVDITATTDGDGYWVLGGDGGVFSYGDANFYGSTGGMHLNAPAVGLTPTQDNKCYWFVASDGGVFAYGDAQFHGSLPGMGIHVSDIKGIVPTNDWGGYWMVGADGGVFAFGDAGFHGSLPGMGISVNDVVAMVPSADNGGYWMVGADGGVFSFGDAGFHGSLGGAPLGSPIAALAATPSGNGYWLVSRSGTVFTFGDAKAEGSPAGFISGQTVVGIASSG